MSNNIFDEIEDVGMMKLVLNVHSFRDNDKRRVDYMRSLCDKPVRHIHDEQNILKLGCNDGRKSISVLYSHTEDRNIESDGSNYGVKVFYFAHCKTDSHTGNLINSKMDFTDFEKGWEAKFELGNYIVEGKVMAFKPDRGSEPRNHFLEKFTRKEGTTLKVSSLQPKAIVDLSETSVYSEALKNLNAEVSGAIQHLIDNLFHRGILKLTLTDSMPAVDEVYLLPKVILGKVVTITFEGENIIDELTKENEELRTKIDQLEYKNAKDLLEKVPGEDQSYEDADKKEN